MCLVVCSRKEGRIDKRLINKIKEVYEYKIKL